VKTERILPFAALCTYFLAEITKSIAALESPRKQNFANGGAAIGKVNPL